MSVLITGASKDIGLQTAIHFVRAGCSKLALAARSSLIDAQAVVQQAASENGLDLAFLALSLDVFYPHQCEAAAVGVKKAFGNLDVVINNAEYLSEFQHIGQSNHSSYRKSFEVNLNDSYLCVRSSLPLLLDSNRSTVINLSSGGAHMIIPGASAYQVSKFALCRLTDFLDAEYRDKGLVAIAWNPGGVKTKLTLSMPDHMMFLLEDIIELPAGRLIWSCKEQRSWLGGSFVTAMWNKEELSKRKEEIKRKDPLKFEISTNCFLCEVVK